MVLHKPIKHEPLAESECERIALNREFDPLVEQLDEVVRRPMCDGSLVELKDGANVLVVSDLGGRGRRPRKLLVQFISGGCNSQDVRCGQQALILVSRRHIRVMILEPEQG